MFYRKKHDLEIDTGLYDFTTDNPEDKNKVMMIQTHEKNGKVNFIWRYK